MITFIKFAETVRFFTAYIMEFIPVFLTEIFLIVWAIKFKNFITVLVIAFLFILFSRLSYYFCFYYILKYNILLIINKIMFLNIIIPRFKLFFLILNLLTFTFILPLFILFVWFLILPVINLLLSFYLFWNSIRFWNWFHHNWIVSFFQKFTFDNF